MDSAPIMADVTATSSRADSGSSLPVGAPSPYLQLDRADWARLRRSQPMSLTAHDVARLQGLGDKVDIVEVEQVYLPLSRLLNYYVGATSALHRITTDFLGDRPAKTPFIIGVAGSVAVGKSTTARILREMLARWPDTPAVQLLTTDGFLHPNAVLSARGLLDRKGFPESYDRRALLRFLAQVKAGAEEVSAPVYSHLSYDIVPAERIVIRRPEVLIVEGLNVLQTPPMRRSGGPALAVSDFFDFSVYVDADAVDIKRWYVERFLTLRETAFADPGSYFHRYAALSDDEARATAATIWERINEPNLVQNVQPTRNRATLVLTKGPDHAVTQVSLRKL